MKLFLTTLCTLLVSLPLAFGQYNTRQNEVWAFGSRAGVDFSSGTPTAITTTISTNEGSASIADASGSLLFYTDGKRIWDRTHGTMSGGGSIVSYGTSSSTQGALIVPVMGSSTQYYVFSLEEVSFSTGYCKLSYTIVDMSLSGGLGAVVGTAGISLNNNLGEKMTAIQGDNCSVWMVTHRRDSTIFLAYPITASGIGSPVVSNIGAITASGSYGGYGIGVLVASPNSRMICTQSYNSGSGSVGTELYDFDPSTGAVTNLRVLDSLTSEYGAEFSPNSQFLYTNDNVGSGARISQYDVTGTTAAAIIATRTTVASGTGYPQMKLGPDGKIYFPSLSASSPGFLDCFATPNVSGSGCGYTSRAVTLNTRTNAIFGMPNAIIIGGLPDTTSYTRDSTVCIGPGDSIALTGRFTGTRYLWNDGDTNATNYVTGPGLYYVYIFNGCHVDVDTFRIIQPPIDTTRYLRTITTCIPTGRTLTLTALATGRLYQWDDGSTGYTRIVASAGNYSVYITNGCQVYLDSIIVRLTPPDTTRVRRDTSLCALRAPITLTGRPGFSSYRWEDGSGGITHSAPTTGIYYVLVTDTCRNVFIDTFRVTFIPPDTTFSAPFDTTLCVALGAINLNAGAGFTGYTWSNGSTAPNITVFATGVYWVRKTINCSMVIDTFKVNYIPIPTLSLGADRFFCVGDTVTLTSVQPAGTTYLWNTGSTATSIQAYTTGTYWLNLYNGCTFRDSVNLTFSSYPVVDLGPDTFVCFGQPILLQSTGTNPSPTYLWSNGATTDTTTAYATDDYWLKVTVLGCATIDTKRVTIYYDTFTLYNRDTAICLGKQVQVFMTANPAATFQWLPTTGIAFSTLSSPLIIPDTTAMYKVQIFLAACPVLEDSFLIDVQPNPIVYAGGNISVCQYDTLHLRAAVTPAWYTGYWYNWSPNLHVDNFTIAEPRFTAGATTKYVVTVSTSAGCVGKDSLVVNVNPGDFAVSSPDVVVCPGDTAQFTATGGVSYQWLPTMYLSDSTIGSPYVNAITNQTYTVIATSTNGCRDTANVRITVYPSGLFYFTEDSINLYPGETVQLSPQTNCSSVNWFPSAGLDNPFIVNPVASPGTSTRYIVTGVTENGCKAKDTIYINVMPESVVKTPNAFTPGKGSNNEFRVNLRGEAKLNYLRIYNRWGNLVFETKNISEGWDGNYNGTPQPFGVYVYVLQAVTGTGQLVDKQGNITLIR